MLAGIWSRYRMGYLRLSLAWAERVKRNSRVRGNDDGAGKYVLNCARV